MGMDTNRARESHFSRLQEALEEGLRAINQAGSPAEAERARLRAKERLEELHRSFEEAFGQE